MDNQVKTPRSQSAHRASRRARPVIVRSSADYRRPAAPKLHRPARKSDTARPDNSWQNPIVGYWSAKYPAWLRKHPRLTRPRRQLPRSKRLEHRILATLAFFSIAVGLWENFRQLWLQQNGFSATDVGNIIGLGTLASVICLLVVAKYAKMSNVKQLTAAMLTFSCINLLALALLNGTGLRLLIDLCAFLDIASSAIIIISIYPLLTTVVKSNAAYSRRKLVEYLFRDLGILIGGIFIGQQIAGFVIDYNACLLISIIFLLIANIIIYRLDLSPTEKAPDDNKFSAFRYIINSKLQRNYMVYTFIAGTAYNTAIALKMLMLTDSFGFSAGIATNYLLVVGLFADLIGIFALKYFTPKNDRFTLFLKFGIRAIVLTLAFLSNSSFICFLALTWTLLSSTAYENVTDGHYINAVDNRHQLKYNTLRYVVHHLGIAFGTFLCGQMFQFGPGPTFGLSALLIVFQLISAFRLIRIRETPRRRISKTLLTKK